MVRVAGTPSPNDQLFFILVASFLFSWMSSFLAIPIKFHLKFNRVITASLNIEIGQKLDVTIIQAELAKLIPENDIDFLLLNQSKHDSSYIFIHESEYYGDSIRISEAGNDYIVQGKETSIFIDWCRKITISDRDGSNQYSESYYATDSFEEVIKIISRKGDTDFLLMDEDGFPRELSRQHSIK
jgi:hypothetical protein